MAAPTGKPIPLQCIPRKRLTEPLSGFLVSDLSLSLSGNIALSGYKKSGETFINLYSGVSPDFSHDPKLFYSKHFNANEKSKFRFTSFLTEDADKIVTCIGNKAEVIDTRNDNTVLQSHEVDGRIQRLVIGEGKIFLFLHFPARVIILNTLFQDKKVVTLKCVKSRDSFWDVAVSKEKLYLCMDYRVIVYNYKTGIVLEEYKYSSKRILSLDTDSIAVNEELGLTVVSWNADLLLLYLLDDIKSVACFKDDSTVSKIRILERERVMLTVNPHCVVTAYCLADLLTYDAVKETLVSLLKKEELVKLAKILGIGMRNSFSVFKPSSSIRDFLTECERKGFLQPSDVTTFEDALAKVNPSHCAVLKTYQKIHQELTENLEKDSNCREKGRHEQRGKIQQEDKPNFTPQNEEWETSADKMTATFQQQEDQPNFTPQNEEWETSADKMTATFQYLSRKICSEWLDVGRTLGVTDEKLFECQETYPKNVREAIYQMLLSWKQSRGSKATYNDLIKALKESGRTDLAEKVEKGSRGDSKHEHDDALPSL